MSRIAILVLLVSSSATYSWAARPLNCQFPPLNCGTYCRLQYPNDHKAQVLCMAAGHHGQGPCFACPCYNPASFTRPNTCPEDEICDFGPTVGPPPDYVLQNFITNGFVFYIGSDIRQAGSVTTTFDPNTGAATDVSCSYGQLTSQGTFLPTSTHSGLSPDQASACVNILVTLGELGPYGMCLKRD